MVFGFGPRQSPWLKDAKRTIKQMVEHAGSDATPDERISKAADDMSRAAKLTEQITHARSALSQDDEKRREAIRTYGNEAQLAELEDELHNGLERVHESTSTIFEESTARLVERMNALAKKLTSTTRTAPPPYITDSIAILEQLKRERDPAQEHTLLERMRKNLTVISAQIESLKTETQHEPSSEGPDSWMQAEVEREKSEAIQAHVKLLEEIRTIIESFLEKRA